MIKLNLIVALDNQGGFSKDGDMPWLGTPESKVDLTKFKEITKNSVCIMGRKTFETMLPLAEKRWKKAHSSKDILPGRTSFVISRNKSYGAKGAYVRHSLRKVFEEIEDKHPTKEVFIIGGESLYVEALSWKPKNIYVTLIDKYYKCDKFFPLKVLQQRPIKNVEKVKDLDVYFIKY